MGRETIHRGGDSVKRAQPTKTKDQHPVDNDKLKADIAAYQALCNEAEANGKEVPQIPDSIGKAFLQIATILSRKHYFVNYSWNEDSIADSVIKCCAAVRKFNCDQGTSAYSYFTQCSYYEFISRINDEKKQKIVKASIVQNMTVNMDDLSVQHQDLDEDFHTTMSDILALQSVEVDYKLKKKKEVVVEECEFNIFDIDEELVIEDSSDNGSPFRDQTI